MPKLSDVCRYVRSKNAGPFWITIDLFFTEPGAYWKHRDDPALNAQNIAAIYGVGEEHVRIFFIDNLAVIKISIPRSSPQGGVVERDMHAGQQFVPLLDVSLI